MLVARACRRPNFLRHNHRIYFCTIPYCAATDLAVAVTWITSPDWENDFVLRISVWVGDPVAVLSVPVASFLFDFISARRSMRLWYIRIPIEVALLVPLWFGLWIYIMLSGMAIGWLLDI